MKFTVIILLALSLGFILGKLGFDPGNSYELALYALIFVIGLDLGANAKAEEVKKAISHKTLALPIATLLGSIIGGIVSSFIVGLPLKWALTISAGVGWYSLTGAILTQYSPVYGVIGFLANFIREVITVTAYPILARILGKEVAISIGGATTMDTTLPLIVKFGGKDAGIIAFIHGFLLSLLVPILVPTLASMGGD
ncbi:lysine exporter LysO family protein [Pyrococcus abyssi]|uniref:Membrane protein, putative n=1 Tax=Pyrococcus abyssi (strain GE5 / Orsay) TaxID=272844 RepID=Q9UYY3_PYRAB|nr:lysine exporter LysO family protein [Pyrococcus abyssi]CAB50279.1 Membrane protein, putative [Pyrococcus abyssi GE5]CCE70817.1 TPA: hypothetical protein PAB0910 [Pyrococcus abyssi GE5]